MKYTINKINDDCSVNVTFAAESTDGVTMPSKDVKTGEDRSVQNIPGLDLSSPEALTTGLEAHARAFTEGLRVEQEDSVSSDVSKDVKALIGKTQTVNTSEE